MTTPIFTRPTSTQRFPESAILDQLLLQEETIQRHLVSVLHQNTQNAADSAILQLIGKSIVYLNTYSQDLSPQNYEKYRSIFHNFQLQLLLKNQAAQPVFHNSATLPPNNIWGVHSLFLNEE